jgi:4-hydroxy-3-methylbut-2-enyl diphosphate reductase
MGRSYRGRALVKRVLLASPRGFCAGVERAVDTVERALRLYGRPVYVRKQIVHNKHVVEDLERQGAIFVDSIDEVPEGSTLVFSAHGVSPAVRQAADSQKLQTIDATCPLVTKVHTQARRYANAGYAIAFIGHAGHEEVEGTMGEAPESIVLVESIEDARTVELPDDRPLAYITQTTLSIDETREIIDVLRARYPQIVAPAKEDICYATSNRQWAVKELLDVSDLLLVIGSRNSSNSKRLVEVAHAVGVASYLVDDAAEIDPEWLDDVETVALTSGASAPERLVRDVCDWFRARGVDDISEFSSAFEDVVFRLPVELRRAERSAA